MRSDELQNETRKQESQAGRDTSPEVETTHPQADRLNLEVLTKVIAFSTALALATGFFYDALFFYAIEPRLFSLLVLSDHIETAASTIPFVIGAVLALGVTLYLIDLVNMWIKVGIAAAILVATILTTDFALLGKNDVDWYEQAALLAMGLATGAAIAIITGGRISRLPDLPRLRIVAVFGLLWISATIAIAIGNAKSSSIAYWNPSQKRALTKFTLTNDGVLVGRIIRLIDRGAIYTSIPGGLIEFIPKDQIRRLEMLRRGSDNSTQ